MGRHYLRNDVAMRRLVAFIAEQQAKNGVAPSPYSIAIALGTSPSQAKRLIAQAEAGGILRRSQETPLCFDIILNPSHLPGIVHIPSVVCVWTRRIKWVDKGEQGVWLDRATYRIEGDPAGLWAIRFPERPREGQLPPLRLNEHSLALVRRCSPRDIVDARWYLVEHAGRVIVGSFAGRERGRLRFRVGVGDTAPKLVVPTEVTAVAELMMTTTRPPGPISEI